MKHHAACQAGFAFSSDRDECTCRQAVLNLMTAVRVRVRELREDALNIDRILVVRSAWDQLAHFSTRGDGECEPAPGDTFMGLRLQVDDTIPADPGWEVRAYDGGLSEFLRAHADAVTRAERAELTRLASKYDLDNHHNAAMCPYCSRGGV